MMRAINDGKIVPMNLQGLLNSKRAGKLAMGISRSLPPGLVTLWQILSPAG